MPFPTLIQRTPRRVVAAFVVVYCCTAVMAWLTVFKPAQMFWQ